MLNDAGGTVVSKTEIAPGVYEIQYQLPNKIYPGGELPTKTVYDPTIYSDTKMADMASEAAAKAQIQFQVTGGKVQQVLVNGVTFEVRFDTWNGVKTVVTAFPAKPKF